MNCQLLDIISSATSAVTYTSVYTNSEPTEEPSGEPMMRPRRSTDKNKLKPPVPQDEDECEPMFIQAHDPDYVPEPIYPEYIPLEDEHEFPAEEQPLPTLISPTLITRKLLTVESRGGSNPEEYEDDETEDGPVDYPMDGGDDDDGDSSRDDADGEDEDEEDEDEEEEEEEHLAPADSTTVIPVDEPVFPPQGTEPVIPPPSTNITIGARITVRPQTYISLPPETEVERLLTMTTPSPSPPILLSPPSVGERLARIASTEALIYAVTAAFPSTPLPPLPPSLYIPPPVDHRDDIPESEQPPRKRLYLSTLGSRYKGIRDVGYGIRGTWVDPAEAVPEIAPMTVGEVNTRVTELAELHEHDTQDLYALLEDAQDRDSMDGGGGGLCFPTHQELQTHRDHVYAHETHLQAHQTQLQLQSTLIQTQHQRYFIIPLHKSWTLRVIRDMRREMSDMQAELLALRDQRRRARQPGLEARTLDHQNASGDADSHITDPFKDIGTDIQKESQRRPNQARDGKDKVNPKPKSSNVRESLTNLSVNEKERYKADIRATNILLQGIPKDIYSLINHYTDAKDIWENVKMIGRFLVTKDDRGIISYTMNLTTSCQIKGETIQGYYVRFTKLINDMRNIKMTMPRMQLNSKFVNNMLPEWSRFITEVKLNRGLKESNFDQLYAYLKQHEVHANENRIMMERFIQPNNDPLALVSDASVQQYPTQSSKSPQSSKEPYPADNFQLDSGSSSTENLIESLSNSLALLTQSYKSHLPQTNNQLRASSNARNKAMVQDGKVVVQDVRGRYNANKSRKTISRNTARKWVDEWIAFDSDVDEGPITQTMFMTNLTSEDRIYDEAGTSYDSNTPSEEDKEIANKTRHDIKESVPLNLLDIRTDIFISAQILLSSTLAIYKTKTEEVIILKKDFKQKEDKFLEEFLDIKRLKDKIEDRLYKQDQSVQTVHMLCKPKSFYDEKNKVAIGYKNPLCLTRAKQAQSALYNGHVLVTTNHTPTIIHDSEDTREIAEITRKRMLLKMQSPLLNTSTEASGSKPRSNTKKNRILPAKRENEKKVEDHLRTNKSVWTKVNRVDSSISYRRVVINSNSESVCKMCNKCLNSANHEMCVVNILSSVNATPTVKIVLNKGKQIWKPKGKLSDLSLKKGKQML
ncbi:hypothetical protein Tco_0059565 [Tanacetum coccineum]